MTDGRTVKTALIGALGDLDLHESVEGILYVTAAGGTKIVGGAWGPAADRSGNWFAWRAGSDPVRVEDRAAAIDHMGVVEVVAR